MERGIYTSYNQRKALGQRYSVDPALLLDQQRMELEYSLMPQRAALAEQRRQFNATKEMQEKANKQQGFSSMVGTAGNLGMLYYLGKGSGLLGSTPAATGMGITPALGSTEAIGAAIGAETGTGALGMGSTVTPTLANGYNASAATYGAAEGMGLIESGAGLTNTTTASTAASGSALGSVVAPVGLGLVAGQIGKSGVGKDMGKAMSLGLLGGEKEQAVMAGGGLGAGAGALAGASYGSVLGLPGAAVGAVVGGIVGTVSSLVDSWICTACHRHVGLTKEEIGKMQSLKEYCEKNHRGWIDSYIVNAPTLVKEIAEAETDIEAFYMRIREILIEPIYKEEDLEKCFDIYLNVVKELFKTYMPEFEFKETE